MSEPRAGARRARRSPGPSLPKISVGPAAVAFGVLVVAALLVLVTPSGPGAASRPAAATGSAVRQTTLGCPRLSPTPDGVKTSYGAALAAVDELSTGEVTTTPDAGVSLTRGRSATIDGTSARGLVVEGADGSAQGLVAWRADTGSSTAVVDCPSPRASWWFTGAGAAIDHESRLVLSNLDTGPAVVDVRVLSPDGEVDLSSTGGRGISVLPGGNVSLSLVDLAPQSDDLSVWVHATRGRVVAAMSDRYAVTPTAESGYEWMPAQTEPSRAVRLAGVPARARSRTLLVGNPSALESVVTVEVAGPSGRFIPGSVGQLSVAPGTVESVDLSEVMRGEPFAVRLRASRPVVAAMRSVLPGGDLTYAGAAQPLTGPAALPVLGRASVQLTAGIQTARAQVTAYSASGTPVGDTRLSIAANVIDSWDLPRGAAYVVVEPTQGTPYGAVVYEGSAVPLRDLPVSIRIPVVQPTG